MKEKIKYIVPAIIIVIILIIIFVSNKTDEQPQEIIENNETIEINSEKEQSKTIKVDIKGEIVNPGVYELKEGERVGDVIKLAGGITEHADTTLINLSKNLKDEMVIIVYNKEEIEKIKQENQEPQKIIEYIEKECTCPDKINDACYKEKNENKKIEQKDITKDKISINKASIDELKELPGLGESKAKAIIEYREKNGNFNKIEDITNVKGIGNSIFEKFKDYITI